MSCGSDYCDVAKREGGKRGSMISRWNGRVFPVSRRSFSFLGRLNFTFQERSIYCLHMQCVLARVYTAVSRYGMINGVALQCPPDVQLFTISQTVCNVYVYHTVYTWYRTWDRHGSWAGESVCHCCITTSSPAYVRQKCTVLYLTNNYYSVLLCIKIENREIGDGDTAVHPFYTLSFDLGDLLSSSPTEYGTGVLL